jgi:hypothetical protein
VSKKNIKKQYDEVASLGCILCRYLVLGQTPAEIHHIRRYGEKRETAEVIPLCPEHHRGNSGVHGMGKKAFARHYGVSEEDLLVMVNYLLSK